MRAFTAALVIVVGTLFLPASVHADGPTIGGAYESGENKSDKSGEIQVTSSSSGVTIYIATTETAPGRPGSDGNVRVEPRPSAPSCTATPTNIGNSSVGWVRDGLASNPGTTPWAVNCDNGYFGIAWVPVDAPDAPDVVVGEPPGPGVDPVAVAQSLLGFVPLPPIAVGTNPGVGLVAMPSWFWVDGYDGSPLRGSRTLGLITVEVEITPEKYEWHFGDGASLETGSLGKPYPEESDIQHRYEQSSFSSGGEFEVRLDITFSARYRVNGGPWQPLAPIVRSFTEAYPVQQLQSVLTSTR